MLLRVVALLGAIDVGQVASIDPDDPSAHPP
jgi:hypothetical protein